MYSYVFGNWGSFFAHAKKHGFWNLSSLGGHPLTQFGTYFTRSTLLICGFPWIKITVLKRFVFYPIPSGDNYDFEKTMRGKNQWCKNRFLLNPPRMCNWLECFCSGQPATIRYPSLKMKKNTKTFFFSFIFILCWFFLIGKSVSFV